MGDVPGPLFLGRYPGGLDDKRRVAIPKAFRDVIDPRRDGVAVYLLQGFDPCLWLFTETRFEAFRSRLTGMLESGFGVGDTKVRAFRRELFSRCVRIEPDKQGRIAISPELGRAATIEKDLIFLGVDDKVEIWAKDAAEVADEPDRLRRLAQELIG